MPSRLLTSEGLIWSTKGDADSIASHHLVFSLTQDKRAASPKMPELHAVTGCGIRYDGAGGAQSAMQAINRAIRLGAIPATTLLGARRIWA